jgi:threonine aldolase
VDVLPCETNILIFSIDETKTSVDEVLAYLKAHGILAVQFGQQQIRLVFHLNISTEMMLGIQRIFRTFR